MTNLPTLKITLYDPETNEVKSEYVRAFVPWKLLKRAIKLFKRIDPERPEDLTEEVVDELAALVCETFGNKFSTHDLDEFSDVGEMVSVITSIVYRARGLMPNPPPPGK